MQVQGSFFSGRVRCHRRLSPRIIDRASFEHQDVVDTHLDLSQYQYHGHGSSERYEGLHFSRLFDEGGTQVSCWLGESLVRYASLPNKATEVTKLETSALGWRRVWREGIGTPLDELGGNSEAFSLSRDRSSVGNGVCGCFEIAAGLVMPLRGSIAGKRGLGTGGGFGAGRGHD